MAKFIVDLWLDGYEDEKQRTDAEKEFIYEQLNMTASSVKIIELPDTPKVKKFISENLK